MTDRYVITSRRGEPVARTNDPSTARALLAVLGGKIIDTTTEGATK